MSFDGNTGTSGRMGNCAISNRRKIGFLSSAAALAVAGLASHANADALSSSSSIWSESTNYTAGTTAQTDPNDFTISNIAASPQSAALARFAPQTLSVGTTIELTGTVALTSTADVGNEQFRFGLYNDNGSAGETGWLGYTAQNAVASGGIIEGKLTGNSSTGPSNGGTYSLGGGTGGGAAMSTGTYTFELALTETDSATMTVTESLVQTVGGTYSWVNTVTDAGNNGGSFSTNSFDAVEFFTAAGQVDAGSTETFTNVQVIYPAMLASNNNATWQPGGTGNWSTAPADATNWVGSAPPATPNSTATFDNGGATSGPVNVDVVGPQQVSDLTFNNPNGYTLAGSTVTVGTAVTSTAGANTVNSLNIGASSVSVSPSSSLTVTNFAHAQYDSINLSGGGTFNINATTNGSLELTGGSTLNITGVGTVASGSAFLYDVGVATAADIINLGTNNLYDSNSLSGNGTIIIGAGSTLTSGEFNGFTFSGSLSGSGSLILGSAAGISGNPDSTSYTEVFLGTSPSFTGSIDVAYLSTLQVGAGATVGSGTITLDSGELQASGNATLANNIVTEDTGGTLGIGPLANGITTIDTQTNTLSLTGHISGTNTLMKIGTGTLVLGASNSYSGGTNVTAGTLLVAAAGALPTNKALSITGGSTVRLADNVTAGTPLGSSNVVLSSLSIDSTSDLDIGNNRVIID
jgi:autotransporter-associated beta strand protein